MKMYSAFIPTLLIVLLPYQGNNALENHNESTGVFLKNEYYNPLENVLFYNGQNSSKLQQPVDRVKRQFYPYGPYYRRRPMPIVLVGGGFRTFGGGLAFGGPSINRFGGRGFGVRGFGARSFGARGFGGRSIGGGRGGRG